jgi:hypothetical protein
VVEDGVVVVFVGALPVILGFVLGRRFAVALAGVVGILHGCTNDGG